MRDGLLSELFLHDVGDDAGDVVREPLEIARELRQALLVRIERERVEQLRSVPVVRGQSRRVETTNTRRTAIRCRSW